MLPMTVYAGGGATGYTFDATSEKLTITSDDGLTAWQNGSIDADKVKELYINYEASITNLFNNCTNLEKVVFDKEATVENAFSGCSALEKVKFNSQANVDSSFHNCSALNTVEFTSGMRAFIEDSFVACPELNTVRIGFGDISSSFTQCPKIETLNFYSGVYIQGTSFSLSKAENNSLKSLTFPQGSTVGDELFQGTQYKALKSVTFEGDIRLADSQFANSSSLEKLAFGGKSELEQDAFKNCPNIKEITFVKKTEIDSALCVSENDPNNSLTKLVFPADSVIGAYSFCNYTALQSVTFEGNVDLSNNQFTGCTGLETITFNGTSKLDNSTFSNCPNISSIKFGGSTELRGNGVLAPGKDNNNSLTRLVFPAGSTVKGDFRNYKALETITFEGDATIDDETYFDTGKVETFYFLSDTPNSAINILKGFPNEEIYIYVSSEAAKDRYMQKIKNNSGYGLSMYYVNAHEHDWEDGCCEGCGTYCKHETCTSSTKHDTTYHWDEYSCGGLKTNKAEHSGGTATCKKRAVCSGCGAEYGQVNANKHAETLNDEWKTSDTQHWKEYPCCDAKANIGNHDFDNDRDSTCNTCGYTRTVYVYHGPSNQHPTVITPENGKIILSSNGRTATITPDEGYEIASVMVNGVDKGKVTEITGLKTGDKVEVTFKKTKATLDAEVRNMVAGLGDFKARSSRVNSKIKVALDMSDIDKETLAAIAKLGYTVKYRYYRSTKKLSGYRAMRTGTTGVYYNTIGKAGKRYYYKGQIRVYDSDGNLVDRTALKDCRYASRRF